MVKRKKFDLPYILIVTILCLWGLIVLYPFYNSMLISIVPSEIYTKTPFLIYPKKIDFSAYLAVFSWPNIKYGFKTTIIVLIFGVMYNLFLTVLTAYALTKPMPGRKLFNYLIIFTMYFSGGLIPHYLLIAHTLKLSGSYLSMILPAGINIMYMLIMRSYFYTIPHEIEESATIDGANDLIILFRIILPLCLPMLATITLYYAVDRWNEWWFGMLFIRSPEKMPLQLHIRNIIQSSTALTDTIPQTLLPTTFAMGIQMATIMTSIIPIMIVYPFLQKYFVKGLTLGAVKS